MNNEDILMMGGAPATPVKLDPVFIASLDNVTNSISSNVIHFSFNDISEKDNLMLSIAVASFNLQKGFISFNLNENGGQTMKSLLNVLLSRINSVDIVKYNGSGEIDYILTLEDFAFTSFRKSDFNFNTDYNKQNKNNLRVNFSYSEMLVKSNEEVKLREVIRGDNATFNATLGFIAKA